MYISDMLSRMEGLSSADEQEQAYTNYVRILNTEIRNNHDFKIDKESGILYYVPQVKKRNEDADKRIVIPKKLRSTVLKTLHDDPMQGAHLASAKTKDVDDWIRGCTECQKYKKIDLPKTAQIESQIAEAPWARLGLDILGPLPETKSGNKYVFVFTDLFSKYTEAFAAKDQTTETAARLTLEEIMARYGSPNELLTDQGAQFTNETAQIIYKLMDTKKIRTSAYHPQTNGQTERFNRTLVAMLRPYIDKNQQNWDELLKYVVYALYYYVWKKTKNYDHGNVF